MLSTKNLLQNCKDVPDVWIYEYYCKLTEKLCGQDIKIKSIFNASEKTPSMCLFAKDGKYYFKDFSTGKGGTSVKLVQEMFGESYHVACSRIIEDYNKYILLHNGTEHKITDFKNHSKYKVTDHTVRQWNNRDKSFWQQFHIGSRLLEKYNVKALDCYKMEKEEDGELKSLTINGLNLYGYFKKDGTLYKIYQPTVKTHKFIKVKDYLQGSEQMGEHPYIIICSSLKDSMVIKSLGIQCDVIVPDSENTVIKKDVIEKLQNTYIKVLTLFDNDDAGIKAMKNYKELYNIDFIYLNLEKDVADAVKAHGVEKVRNILVPIINTKING